MERWSASSRFFFCYSLTTKEGVVGWLFLLMDITTHRSYAPGRQIEKPHQQYGRENDYRMSEARRKARNVEEEHVFLLII